MCVCAKAQVPTIFRPDPLYFIASACCLLSTCSQKHYTHNRDRVSKKLSVEKLYSEFLFDQLLAYM